MPKRDRDSADALDDALEACRTVLEGDQFKVQDWSSEDRMKLARFLNVYLSSSSPSTATGDQNGSAAAAAASTVPATPSLGQFLSETDQKLGEGAKAFTTCDSAPAPDVNQLFVDLQSAKDHLRAMIRPSNVDEKAAAPTYEEDVPTFEIDSFLYDDDDEVETFLVEPGHVSRNYCTKCQSHEDVLPTRFISHSFSRHQLVFWFRYIVPKFVLPQLSTASAGEETLQFLDVGSRLGIVPITAALSLPAPAKGKTAPTWVAKGVEFNPEYCQYSNKLLNLMATGGAKKKLLGGGGGNPPIPEGHWAQRVSFHQIDIFSDEGKNLLENSDLICLNNVFEWYSETEKLLGIWRQVREATQGIKPGKRRFLMTNPSLEESLGPITDTGKEVKEFLQGWVKEVNMTEVATQFTQDYLDPEATKPDEEQMEPLHLYEVLPRQ